MSEFSIYEANILDFAYVLEQQPNLLTLEDRLSLRNLLKTLPDDVNEISNEITIWYENRPNIEEAIFKLPTNSSERGAGSRKIEITAKDAKEIIENAIRQSEQSQK